MISVKNGDKDRAVKVASELVDLGYQIAATKGTAAAIAAAGIAVTVVNKVKEGSGSFGFNAVNGQYEDLLAAGVIDPAKVSRTALQNASSVASLMLTTEAMVAERPKEDEPKMQGGGGGGGMGGMGGMM